MIAAALAHHADIEAIYAAPEVDEDTLALEVLEDAGHAGVEVVPLAGGVIERVADASTPQPLIAVVRSVDVALEAILSSTLVFVLVDVRDPGNLGAILRVADATGAGGVVCCAGTADVYNPKTVRASAGSLFSVAVVVGPTPTSAIGELRRSGFRIVGTAARGGVDYTEASFEGKVALVFGNEASGLGAKVTGELDETVSVTMAGAVESLNVATAAAVLAFEVVRVQRGSAGGAVR